MLAYKVPYTEIMYNTKHIAYCKCKTNTNNYLVIVFTNILVEVVRLPTHYPITDLNLCMVRSPIGLIPAQYLVFRANKYCIQL